MSDQESHPIRNGTIATVIGGLILALILSSSVRDLAIKIVKVLWGGILWVGVHLISSYPVPGWILLFIILLSLPGIKSLLKIFKKKEKPDYLNFTETLIYGAKWRWVWLRNSVHNLWCYCPRCDATLVYSFDYLNAKTDFICERCNNRVVASVPGGNKDYAIGAAEREILRRIRKNEYKRDLNS